MKIPPKAAAIFGLWTSVLLWTATGSTAFPDWITPDWVGHIKTTAMWFGALNSTILSAMAAWSAVGVGPWAPPPTTAEAKAIQAQAVQAALKS